MSIGALLFTYALAKITIRAVHKFAVNRMARSSRIHYCAATARQKNLTILRDTRSDLKCAIHNNLVTHTLIASSNVWPTDIFVP